MNLSEYVKRPTGHVEIWALPAKHREKDPAYVAHKLVDHQNMIMNNCYRNLCYLLGGGSDSYFGRSATIIQFGTGNATPTEADTALDQAVSPALVAVPAYSGSEVTSYTWVKFSATLAANAAIGSELSEVGLFCSGSPNSTLLARVTFGPLHKDENWTFAIDWTVRWSLTVAS